MNSNTSLPLKGVTVSIPDYELVTVTDEDGYFMFDELLIGSYRLTCSKQGYPVPAEQKVDITADATSLDVDFELVAVEA
jgi:hypothetical protein